MPELKTITMTIIHVNHPAEGTTRGWIKGSDGKIIGVFADKIGMFEKGKTYNITGTPWEDGNGKTGLNFKSAVLAEPAQRSHTGGNVTPMTAPAATASPQPSHGDGENYRQMTNPRDSKNMFVCANLVALIRAGEVHATKESVWAATQILSQTWEHVFGSGNTFLASEAGRVASHR